MQFPEPTITGEILSAFGSIWRLWVPLFLLLIGVGLATRRWWGGRLLLISLLGLTVFVTHVAIREREKARETLDAWNRLRVPLTRATTLDGLRLQAGTVVRWDNERQGHLLTAELGAGQEVSPGIMLSGEARLLWSAMWRGTLVDPSFIRGWNCAAGEVDIHTSGKLRRCLSATPQDTPAGSIPAGTRILMDDPSDPSDALLHLSDMGFRASPGNFWVAPQQWIVLYPDGELLEGPGPITFRATTLGDQDSGVVLRYGAEDVARWYADQSDSKRPTLERPIGPLTGFRGNLASSLMCDEGKKLEKGRTVTIPLSGNIVTTTHWDSSRPHARPVIDSLHCELGPAK